MILYILTGQKKDFWKKYFKNYKLIYERWWLMMNRGWLLKKYYIKKYGVVLGSFLLLNHGKIKSLKTPFRYYKTIEGFIIKKLIISIITVLIIYKLIENFNSLKFWFIKKSPNVEEIIYMDNYYPYSIFLVVSIVMIIQLLIIMNFKTIWHIIKQYKYEIIILNVIVLFVLITVHCTVAHEGLLYVWWIPENYEMITFSNEEELVMEYWIREMKYMYKEGLLNEKLITLKYIYKWLYIIMYIGCK